MIKYGLISETDGRTLEKTMDLIRKEFPNEIINTCEVGVYAGETTKGIFEYLEKRGIECFTTGIDNNRDNQKIIYSYYSKLIIGNSNEVYNQLEDESQHLIFIDGLHTFTGVISDFFAYAPKVKNGGFIAFHDTGVHINPLHGWQGVGDKNDSDMCLGGVRKALESVGLFQEWGSCREDGSEMRSWIGSRTLGFELVLDEADPNDDAGGICVFKKIK